MSRVILTKTNLEYIPAYQLMTKIIQAQDGSRMVIKSPLHPDAVSHAEGLKRGAEMLPQLFAKVSSPACTLSGDAVSYQFIQGDAWLTLLLDAAGRGREAYLSKWRAFADLMTPKDSAVVPFTASASFELLFGGGEAFAGMPSFPAVPFDLTPSNVFHTPAGEDLAVDCEWMVDGPLPLDLLRYHAVHATLLNYPQLQHVATEEEVLRRVGVAGDVAPLQAAWQHFIDHIFLTDKEKHPYELRYAKPVVTLQSLRESEDYHRALVAQLQDAVGQLNKLADELRDQNVRLFKTVTEKQQVIERLFNELGQVHHTLGETNEQLFLQNAQMEQLQHWREEYEAALSDELAQSQELAASVEEKEQEIQTLETWLSRVRERIGYLEERNRLSEQALRVSQGREAQLQAEKNAMENSWSWRSTAPLRKIRGRLRRKQK